MTASDLLRQMVRFPSLSRQEGEIAAFVEALGRTHGLRVWRLDDNVVWELGEGAEGGGPGDVLLFNSHLDVVPPSAEMPHGAFDGHEADGVLWGRGTVDAKASGAAMLAAMLALKREGWTPEGGGTLLVALTACEEMGGGYNGLEALRPHLPPLAGALVGEPTEMHPCLAQKGLLILHVDAKGRTAHAARPHLGDNAIWRLARDLDRLRALRFDRDDPFFGLPTLTPTVLEAGSARNVVPDTARVTLDIRSTPAYTHDELIEIVRAAVEGAVVVHSARYVPVATPETARVVQAVRAAHPGGVPFGSPTASDWTFLADVPTVKIGPGPSERSHTPDERIELHKVDEAAAVYAATARAFFAC